jgi:hypothetical protein
VHRQMRRDGSAWQIGPDTRYGQALTGTRRLLLWRCHVLQHWTHLLAFAPVAATVAASPRVLDRKPASAGGFAIRSREPTKGFEPPTRALRKRCSTPELRRLASSASISMGSGLDRAATDAAGPNHEHPHAGGYATRRKPSAPAATSSSQVEQTVRVAWQSSQKTWRPSTTKAAAEGTLGVHGRCRFTRARLRGCRAPVAYW